MPHFELWIDFATASAKAITIFLGSYIMTGIGLTFVLVGLLALIRPYRTGVKP